jgi:hypothetical protein
MRHQAKPRGEVAAAAERADCVGRPIGEPWRGSNKLEAGNPALAVEQLPAYALKRFRGGGHRLTR